MKPNAELAKLFEPVLEWLDNGGDEQYKFDMHRHYNKSPCGTTCCIVGAIGLLNDDLNWGEYAPKVIGKHMRAVWAEDALTDNYGMNMSDAYRMFYGNMEATPAKAAKVIRHWIATGDVDWSIDD